MLKKTLSLCLALVCFLIVAHAENPVLLKPVQSPIAPPVIAPADLEPRVIMISTVHTINAQKIDAVQEVKNVTTAIRPQVAYPGNIIRFTITNPLVFLKSRPTDQSRVVIYINGVELKGVSTGWYTSVTNIQIANSKVPLFKNTADIDIALKRNDTTQRAWNFFYANTNHFFDNYTEVDASIGWEGMSSLEKDRSKTPTVRIVYYSAIQFIVWMSLFTIILVGFGFLAFQTNAIRECQQAGAYSLSLTQLLFWTTLVIGAFIYTLVLTDVTSSFNPSVLYMLGISLTTTGVASTIDSRFNKANPGAEKKPHYNFFKDVLTSDGNNYSVQRIQIFAWNLLLGIYFISYTINNKSMPVFSETLLFLAGFSSLSYLGAKPPENTAASPGAVAPVAQAPVAEPQTTPITPAAAPASTEAVG
jgi:hypothetical protein